MKRFKNLMALLVAMVMVLAMGTTAFADDPDPVDQAPAAQTVDYDQPLTVSGLTKDDVAHFYKVVEWVGDAKGNVSGWKATSDFASVLTEEKLKEVLVGTKADATATPPVEAKEPTGITSELAGQLARLATGTSVDVTATAEGKAVLDNDAAGLWMAIITPVDPDTVYNPVFVGSDYNKDNSGDVAVNEAETYADEAAAKKSTVELKKTAKTTEDSWDDAKWQTVAIGDTVSFTVNTTIPGYGKVYTNPVFKLTDKLKDMTLDTDSVTIKAPTGLTKDKDYTITATTAGYTIEFKAEYLKKCTVPTAVTVEYTAKVATTAPVHVNTEKNEVSTEFSHNPSNENDHGFKKDTTQHYTFTLDASGLGSTSTQSGKKTSELVKIGVDAKGDPITETRTTSEIDDKKYVEGPLADAEFKLYTDDKAQNEYVPKKADGTTGTALAIKSGADGRMTIAGLDAGTYYLQESKAPAGFVRDTSIHKIEIAAVTDEVDVTEYTTDGATWISAEDYENLGAEAKKAYKSYTYKTEVLKSYTVKIDGEETATYNFTNSGTDAEIDWTVNPPKELPFDIINTQGTELPSTGGIGTTLFYIIGGVLVAAAAVLLVTRRRMNAR